MRGPSYSSITSPSALQALHGLKTSVQGRSTVDKMLHLLAVNTKKIDSKSADPTHFIFFLQQTPTNVQIFFIFFLKILVSVN